MHGLIFETSIWLLAGSTRLLSSNDRKRPQVVRFANVWRIVEAASDACARTPPNDLCFRDLQSTRPGLSKRTSQRKHSLEAKALDANLLQVARGSPEAGFAALIDYQTLVTHNHTIICGSLWEGLTYSPCARHAQAYCHKKDCVCREVLPETIPAHSFKFLFTVSCPIQLEISEIVSLLYIAKNFSARLAIVLIKITIKIALSRFN